MAVPKQPADLVNANTWSVELYNEAFEMRWPKELEERLALSMITEFIPAQYNTKIERPTFSLVPDVEKGPWTCERGGVDAFEAGVESFILDNYYKTASQYCDINVAHTKIGLGNLLTKIDKELKTALKQEMNRDAYDMLIANAGNTFTAVTDAASAMAAVDQAISLYGGYEEDMGIVAYVPHTLLPFFREIATSRFTNLGDRAIQTGEIIDVLGVKIIPVSGSVLTPANAAKVVFAVGKPVSFYFDGAMNMVNTFNAPLSDGKYVNENKIREVITYGQFVFWPDQEQFVSVA